MDSGLAPGGAPRNDSRVRFRTMRKAVIPGRERSERARNPIRRSSRETTGLGCLHDCSISQAALGVWIPGSRLAARPGMTVACVFGRCAKLSFRGASGASEPGIRIAAAGVRRRAWVAFTTARSAKRHRGYGFPGSTAARARNAIAARLDRRAKLSSRPLDSQAARNHTPQPGRRAGLPSRMPDRQAAGGMDSGPRGAPRNDSRASPRNDRDTAR